MPYCPKCGTEVREDANFCRKCGYDLRRVDKISDGGRSPTSQAVNTKKQQLSMQYSPIKSKSPDKVKRRLVISLLISLFFAILFPPLFIISIIILIAYVIGIFAKCPSCGKLYATSQVGSELLDADEGYETVSRTDTVYDNRGRKRFDIHREEQVHMIYKTYLMHYRCKFCGFEWREVKSEKYEG